MGSACHFFWVKEQKCYCMKTELKTWHYRSWWKSIQDPRRNRKQNQILGPSGGISVRYHSWGVLSNSSFLCWLPFTDSEGDELSSCEVICKFPFLQKEESEQWYSYHILHIWYIIYNLGQPALGDIDWAKMVGPEDWQRTLPKLNHFEILLSFWPITSLPSGYISEWMQSIPLWFV